MFNTPVAASRQMDNPQTGPGLIGPEPFSGLAGGTHVSLPGVLSRGEGLYDFLANYGPRELWDVRLAMASLPRPSYGEQKARDWLKSFAQSHKLESLVDKAGNLIIRVPGRGAGVTAKPLILQAHMDMVCIKEDWAEKNPAKDGVDLVAKRQQIKGSDEFSVVLAADGTTSGDDNGIGVAFALCAAVSPEVKDAPPLEIFLTVAEEMDMDGAEGFEPGLLQGIRLLNLDNETHGEILVSSGGNCELSGYWKVRQEPAAEGAVPVSLILSGLPGGHSAMEIEKGRGNAIQSLADAILKLSETFKELKLASIDGGSATNEIPTRARAVVWLQKENIKNFQIAAAGIVEEVVSGRGLLREYSHNVRFSVEVCQESATLPLSGGLEALKGICAVESMAFSQSERVPGLTAASNNAGIVKTDENAVILSCLARGESDSSTDQARQRVAAAISKTGGEATLGVLHAAWEPEAPGELFRAIEKAYRSVLGRAPAVNGCHGALETGIIKSRMPHLEMSSIGPDIFDVHSVREHTSLNTIRPLWEVIKGVLQDLCCHGTA